MEQLMDQGGAFMVIMFELVFLSLCSTAGYKVAELLWPHLKPVLKKNEPAIRQRVHEFAKAINW